MFILITVGFLLFTALTLLVLRLTVPAFRYIWLVAVGGGLLAWVSIFVWQTRMPILLEFPVWGPAVLFSQSPKFTADGIAWAFSLSIVTLCFAIILTSVVRSNFPNSLSWTGSFLLAAFGVLAVVAENPITLVLIWAAIDLIELITQLIFVENPILSERAVIAFATRLMGTLVLLWANMVSAANGQVFDFLSAPPQAGLYLLIAPALRLGVLPLHLPYPSESAIRRGFGTGLRMISAASSLILLTRIPASSLASPIAPYILILISVAAVYGGWMWLRAPDELTGRPYWLIGVGSLAVAAALQGNPIGAAAWGCALILSGGVLFLSSEPNKILLRSLWVGALGISALPFTLTGTGWINAGSNLWIAWVPLLLTHAMLFAGYIRQIQRSPASRVSHQEQPIWGKNIYPFGIYLLLITTIILSIFGWNGSLQPGNWIAGFIALFLTFGLIWFTPRLRILNPVRAHWVRPTNITWLDRVYQFLWNLYRQLGRLSTVFTNILEGESGIMWTLLFLALFISYFAQQAP
ncbi:MAG TPA: hypothetical protein VJ022_00815 [Anaerolineales bacterium]|nr:hypothetical protein [Anaerolineales bacterium]